MTYSTSDLVAMVKHRYAVTTNFDFNKLDQMELIIQSFEHNSAPFYLAFKNDTSKITLNFEMYGVLKSIHESTISENEYEFHHLENELGNTTISVKETEHNISKTTQTITSLPFDIFKNPYRELYSALDKKYGIDLLLINQTLFKSLYIDSSGTKHYELDEKAIEFSPFQIETGNEYKKLIIDLKNKESLKSIKTYTTISGVQIKQGKHLEVIEEDQDFAQIRIEYYDNDKKINTINKKIRLQLMQ